jgi:hypothetical protein
MIDKVALARIKAAFSNAFKELRKENIVPENFVGKFQVNCNSGGVTSVEANITIR